MLLELSHSPHQPLPSQNHSARESQKSTLRPETPFKGHLTITYVSAFISFTEKLPEPRIKLIEVFLGDYIIKSAW